MNERRTALAVVGDLMFRVKLESALRQAGYAVAVADNPAAVTSGLQQDVDLLVIDLEFQKVEPLELIARLQAERSPVYSLGYVSHVRADLISDARSKGCQRVVARSAIVETIQKLDLQHAEANKQ